MFLLVGAPVYAREWILPEWFAAIERQDWPLRDVGFVFEAALHDEATINELFRFQVRHPELRCFNVSINDKDDHKTHIEGQRYWSADRYHTMVRLRNNLLARVRCIKPDLYFSLDTDILLEDPETISKLASIASRQDCAVAPLMYMTPQDDMFPSVMSWADMVGGHAFRRHDYPLGETFQSDIIMAAKMMSKSVYEMVNYKWHRQGEDLGWSAEATVCGFPLFSMSGTYAPHIMSRAALEEYRISGDSRNKSLHKL